MAIKFLQNVSLEGGEVQNFVVHQNVSDPSDSGYTAADKGRLIFNSSSNVLKFYNGSAWVTLSSTVGDVTAVIAGDGLTGGGSSGDLTLNVVGGNGITANANDVAITAAQTTITSILNTSLILGRDNDNKVTFATDNQITFRVSGNDGVIFKASGEIEATKFDGALEGNADTATALATARAINGVDFDGTAAITVTAAAGTLTGNTLNSGVTASSLTSLGTIATGVWNGTAIASAYLDADTAHLSGTQTFTGAKTFTGTLALTGTGRITGIDTVSASTDAANKAYVDGKTFDDVSNANLLTALANLESTSGTADENIVIGTDSGDTIVITGNLQVLGTTTTLDTQNLTVEDNNIVLSSGNTTSAAIDGAGITLEGGTGDDVTWMWSASSTRFEAKVGSSLTRIAASDFYGNLSGNSTTATTATVATNVTAVANNSNNETVYLTFVDGATGQQGIETDTGLNYNPSTGVLTTTSVTGNLTGNVTGNTSGSSGSCTGNASTATRLETAREINGISFNGSANIDTGHAANIGDGSNTSIAVTHNLGSRDVVCQVYDNSSPYDTLYVAHERTDTNNVTFKFRSAPTTDQYRVVIQRVM